MITKRTMFVTETSGWRHAVNAVVYTPDNVATIDLPLILFNHGVGEHGYLTTDVDKLLTQGLPLVLNGTFIPPFSFVMVALQHNSWSPPAQWDASVIDEAYSIYKIDKTKVFLTGLSAGGQTTWDSQFTSDVNLAKKFLAIAPLSAANGANLSLATTFKITNTPVWASCGDSDRFEPSNLDYANAVNGQVPGLCTYTKIPATGHGDWIKVYDGTIKDANGKNIWDFFASKLSAVVPPPIPVPIPPIPPVKVVKQVITLYTDNTWI